MLSAMLLSAATGGLIQFIIVAVVLGAVVWFAYQLTIPDIFKKGILVVAGVVLFILALKVLLPMAGV